MFVILRYYNKRLLFLSRFPSPPQIPRKTTSDCVQLYYFWKKLSVHYKAPHLLKDWTEMAGKRAKFENYEKTAARTMSESGSRGNFTAAAPNYSATSAALGGSSHSLSSAGTEISKLMSTAGAATSFSTSAMTMSAAPPSSSSSSHHDVRPYICEMPDCSAVNKSIMCSYNPCRSAALLTNHPEQCGSWALPQITDRETFRLIFY